MSSRGKRVVYEDLDSDTDAEFLVPVDDSAGEGAAQGFTLSIEKILGRKVLRNEEDPSAAPVEHFFIKWKQLSYLHASWETLEDIEKVDPNAKVKIKRFMQSPQLPGIKGERTNSEMSQFMSEFDDEPFESEGVDPDDIEYFSSEFVEVQRIISCSDPSCVHSTAKTATELSNMEIEEDPEDEESQLKYLVKWRGLGYNECTWEVWEDIRAYYVEAFRFWARQRPPALDRLHPPGYHPPLNSYHKLTKSPVFGELAHGSPPSRSRKQQEEETVGAEVVPLYLRDYQLEGVNWLLWNWFHRRPCILADEMGLGKTIQSVCFLHQLRYMDVTNNPGPFLLVAPLSLVNQWHSEVQMWSPRMNCVILHGSAEARETIINHEFYYNEPYVSKQEAQRLKRAGICKFHILLTTFEVAIKDVKTLSKIPWKVLIVDEAHRLKNPSSRLFEELTQIPRDHVLLLTGTPLQNKTEELWALLHFADRQKFADQAEFMSKYGDLKDASHVAKLHAVLKPYLLRRIKEDVEKSLPPKEETIVEVALTSIQKQFYRAIYEKNTVHLFKGTKASNQPSLMNVMMELRKCCNHPYLVRGVEERILSELTDEDRGNKDYAIKKMIESSGKLVLLDKLLPKLYSQGHKVLIFSQMVRVLNILEDFMRFKGYSFERLDGSSRASDRNEAVQRFIRPSLNRFVMLLSTKAGGLGLNLTAADTVIIFDSDWNPQNDLQAQARAHRIGQTKAVMVYRLLTRKTYEMHMFHKASLKLGLDRAVLAQARAEQEDESGMGNGSKPNLTVQEIDELLKRGAYDVFREDESEQKEIADEDIDSILERRSHKVVYDSTGKSSGGSTLGGFSKASFVSFDEKEDVDINDPDFWTKAVGLKESANTEEEEGFMEQLKALPNQRNRRRTQVNDTLDHDALEEYLKPIKVEKEKKAGFKGEKGQKNPKDKLQNDNEKVNNDPMMWGPHARDRILRALNLYGFGRWSRIKNESGGDLRELKDVESFARSYILQCGLYASEQELSKSDSDFVRDAVSSAKAVYAHFKSGEKKLDTPASLLDEKFVSKMKGGMAKKTLNRLDLLARLTNMVQKAIDVAYANRKETPDPTLDIDGWVQALPLEEVANSLPIGDMRPAWTKLESWWDVECDRHLILGTFKLGYGRYDLMKDDPELCFAKHIEEFLKTKKSAEGEGFGDVEKKMDEENGNDGLDDDNMDIEGGMGEKLGGEGDDMSTSQKSQVPSIADLFGDPSVTASNTLQITVPYPKGRSCKLLVRTDRTSQFRGVYPQPGSCRWVAIYNNKNAVVSEVDATVVAAVAGAQGTVATSGKKPQNLKYLGSFDTQTDAARAYDKEARLVEGDEALVNFNDFGVYVNDAAGVEPEVKVSPQHVQQALPNQRPSKYRGVRASGQKWTAQISYDGGTHHLGTYVSELEAAMVYDATARAHHGDGAALNFSRGLEEEVAGILQEVGYYGALYSAEGTLEKLIEGGSMDAKEYGAKFSDPNGNIGIARINKSIKSKNMRRSNTDELVREKTGDEDDDDTGLVLPASFIKESAIRDPSNGNMPDARTLNRLLIWLISSDEAKLMKSEFKAKPKRQRASKTAENAVDGGKGDSKPAKGPQIDYEWYNSNMVTEGFDVLRGLYQRIDSDAIAQVYKPNVSALKKCEETILSIAPVVEKAAETGANANNNSNGNNSNSSNSSNSSSLQSMLTISAMFDGIPAVRNEIGDAALTITATAAREENTETPLATINEFDAQKLCAALILLGLPLSDTFITREVATGRGDAKTAVANNNNNNNSNNNSLPSKTIATPSKCIEYLSMFTLQDASHGDAFAYWNWKNTCDFAGLSYSEDKLREFYSQTWLPFCAMISRGDVTFTQKSLVPNPFRKCSEHHLATRGLCHIFLQRQQLLRTMQYLLCYHFDSVLDYLRSPRGRDCEGMPVWYCPWIHDVAVMFGSLKHGFLHMDSIFNDPSLPFTPQNLEWFAKRVFLFGSSNVLPSAYYELKTVEDSELWLKLISYVMPESRHLENRLLRIFADLTSNLPIDHPLKVIFDIDDISASGITGVNIFVPWEQSESNTDKNSHYNTRDRTPKAAAANDAQKEALSVPLFNRKRPAMSLKRFLLESSKRRRTAVQRIHSDLLEGSEVNAWK